MRSVILLCLSSNFAAAQNGPGSGAWKVATPESQGLDSSALDKAAVEITEAYEALGYTRDCFLVVKNGLIVSEKYYNG